MLFKLPYEKTPFETLDKTPHWQQEKCDMADCLFGTIKGDKSLKGRVVFGHAFCETAQPMPEGEIKLVLSSPKASYYPTYIAQDGRGANYQTYNDGRIAGWKRYVVKRDITAGSAPESDNIVSILTPLQAGTQFRSVVRFHNLKPEELGALLAALNFHNHPKAYHQLGQGKPYGYGKVTIVPQLDIPSMFKPKDMEPKTMEKYIEDFDHLMWKNEFLVNDTRLVAMAMENTPDNKYRYMTMSNKKDENQFLMAKKNKEYLPAFVSGTVDELRQEQEKAMGAFKKLQKEKEEQQDAYYKEKMKEAEELLEKDEIEEALAMAKELKSVIQTERLELFIGQCESKLENKKKEKEEKERAFAVSIHDFLSRPVSSIPAFSGALKKWIEQNHALAEDEICQVANRLKSVYGELPSKSKKNWSMPKNWESLNKMLEKDLYSMVIKQG